MNSRSQAGQDIFCRLLHPEPGTFLDIGAAGLDISNTFILEDEGWRGWLVDNSVEAERASYMRSSKFFCTDATRLDYSFLPRTVSYLSLDIDGASLDALKALPIDRRFSVITAEHDAYSRGDTLRQPMLKILRERGYSILCENVCHEGHPFEIWACDSVLVDMTVAEKFRRNAPTDWKEILNVHL